MEVLLQEVSQPRVVVVLDLQEEIITLLAEQVLEDQDLLTLSLVVWVDRLQVGLPEVVAVHIFHQIPLMAVLEAEAVVVQGALV
jgi:hypothetical protein